MPWIIEYTDTAKDQLKKLDQKTIKRILKGERIAHLEDPRSLAKPLAGALGELWRYQIDDYHIICDVQNDPARILVLTIKTKDALHHN